MATPQLALNESSFTVLFHLFVGEKIVYLRLNLGDRLEVVPYTEPLMMVLSFLSPAMRLSLVLPIGIVMFSSM